MLAAYLAKTADDRTGSVTLLNTLLDYSEPGMLGAFADERTISRLEADMARTGVMEGSTMAGTFDALRANDLIFSYVVSNWLMGQTPPAFDILAWNADSTRLPAAMHSFLPAVPVCAEPAGQGRDGDRRAAAVPGRRQERHLHRRRGERPHRALAVVIQGNRPARRDRPVRAVQRRPHRGHRQPAGPKAWHQAGEHDAQTPQQWRETAERHHGSWWEDWTRWADTRAGRLVQPPPMGSDRHPALGDAPGDYVSG